MKILISIISAILYLSSFTACNKSSNNPLKLKNTTDSRLKLIGKYELNIPEPSGLEIDFNSDFLWTVSDENSYLYKISTHGQKIDSIKIDGRDLEGVAKFNSNQLCLITERDRGLVVLDSTMKLNKRVLLDLPGELNSGPEGVSYNSLTKKIYVINEKNPKLLLELDENQSITKRYSLNYAKDFSGLYFDETNKYLWIVSDESQTLIKSDTTGKVIDSYKVDIPQVEGIAIDNEKNLIYIVSDNTECLYVFTIGKAELQ